MGPFQVPPGLTIPIFEFPFSRYIPSNFFPPLHLHSTPTRKRWRLTSNVTPTSLLFHLRQHRGDQPMARHGPYSLLHPQLYLHRLPFTIKPWSLTSRITLRPNLQRHPLHNNLRPIKSPALTIISTSLISYFYHGFTKALPYRTPPPPLSQLG